MSKPCFDSNNELRWKAKNEILSKSMVNNLSGKCVKAVRKRERLVNTTTAGEYIKIQSNIVHYI